MILLKRLTALLAVLGHSRLVVSDLTATNYDAYNEGAMGHRPFQRFRTIDEFGPVLQVTTWDKTATSSTNSTLSSGSHIFMRHDGHDELDLHGHRKPGQSHTSLSSPLILDASDLSTVYVNRSFHNVFGARIQEDRGKKYFTFWAGHNIGGFGDGRGLVYDETYRLIYNVTADNPNHVDLHEFALTGHGTALVAAVEWLSMDALIANWSSLDDHKHLSGARLLDSRFQEIDLETNKVLFDWRATDHIDPADSMEGRSNAWDPYHLNSIQKTAAGHYLVSLRHLHSIMLIDGQTGVIRWTLGGKRNEFVEVAHPSGLSPTRPLLDGQFRWQHHAHYVPGTNETQMTFFDNYAKQTSHGLCVHDCSRGVHIAIDSISSQKKVQLLGEFVHPARIQAQSQGSVQILQSEEATKSNVFVGWGHCPGFTEHDAVTGKAVLDVQFSPWPTGLIRDALDNYRAYKMDWVGMPYWDPELLLEGLNVTKKEGSKVTAYVSWNGATEVNTWTVQASSSKLSARTTKGTLLAQSIRTGFETTLVFSLSQLDNLRYVWAEAVDKDGTILRTSAVVDLHEGEAEDVSSTKIHVVVGVGIGALSLVLMAVVSGVYIWRRRSGYRKLEASDGENIEMDGERDKSVAVFDDVILNEAFHVVGSDSENEDDDDNVDVDTNDGSDTGEEAPLRGDTSV
ncbi:hypothetical protein Sste5346_001478 [Sporothrix stenoceras]|uniref:Arylsulfotransferase n=1 Tax=Sporothrix stenoceras TaxID=5173 RepID=A0ABR3ZQH5_9PEZI